MAPITRAKRTLAEADPNAALGSAKAAKGAKVSGRKRGLTRHRRILCRTAPEKRIRRAPNLRARPKSLPRTPKAKPAKSALQRTKPRLPPPRKRIAHAVAEILRI